MSTDGVLRQADSLLISAQIELLGWSSSQLLIATCVVPYDSIFWIKVLNPSSSTISISQKAVLGEAEIVNETESMPVMAVTEETRSIDWNSVFPLRQLSAEHPTQAHSLMERYRNVFAFTRNEIGKTEILEHEINTREERPVKLPYRRLPQVYLDAVDEQLDWMIERGIIQWASHSPWAAPLVMVRKRDGSMRMCVDYRWLNDVTSKDSFPLPHVADILDSTGGCSMFSTIDLASGYYQVPIKETDRPKTAFVTHRGLYEFTRMPFGVCNGPSTFQRLMAIVLKGLLGDRCLCYLDDIILFSDGFDAHLKLLEMTFQKLMAAGLTIKPTKCSLFEAEVLFLGTRFLVKVFTWIRQKLMLCDTGLCLRTKPNSEDFWDSLPTIDVLFIILRKLQPP